MFSWLEEVERKSFNTVPPEHKPFRIEKMQLETDPTNITELVQLFTAASSDVLFLCSSLRTGR